MKTRHSIIVLAAFNLICWSMTSCETIRVTLPDGTVTETTRPADGSIPAAVHVVDTVVDGDSGK